MAMIRGGGGGGGLAARRRFPLCRRTRRQSPSFGGGLVSFLCRLEYGEKNMGKLVARKLRKLSPPTSPWPI